MDVFEAIKNRRSVRAYKDTPIPADLLNQLLQSLRLAPSAKNNQPWKFIVVTNQGQKEKLAKASGERMWIAKAPIIIVGCGFPEQAYQTMGGYGNSVDVDLSIAIDHLTLFAASKGLGTCWIGAFSEKDVKAILEIPEDVKIIAITPVGYPESKNALKPCACNRRKPLEEIVVYEKF